MGGGIGATPEPFTYATTTHIRRHGPYGYRNYKSLIETGYVMNSAFAVCFAADANSGVS
jgi:hypothetical protein